MKLLNGVMWLAAAVAALLWTGGAAATAGVLQWAAGLAASGDAAELGRAVTAWPVPPWMSFWFDAQAIESIKQTAMWAVSTLQHSGPWVASLLGWLVPLTWVLWGLGLVLLLLLAIGAQWLLRRWGAAPRAVG